MNNKLNNNKRIKLDTLGCKLNQAETEMIAEQFVKAGCRLVTSLDEADIYVLNTCTVTHIADRKSRHLLRLANRRNPEAIIVATGCYARRKCGELADIYGVDMVLDNDDKTHVVRLLEAKDCINISDSNQGDSWAGCENNQRDRAFIKAQDGCDNSCAYCIVPLVRGWAESLPVELIIAQVRNRIDCDCKEIVLTGTEIGTYRYNGFGLRGLIEKILSETNIIRLRLSSLQPHHITPELLGLWHDKRLCPHLHLSLQSGSDSVLKLMKRNYTTKDYHKAVSLIRSMVPQAAITTDVIVGFPGESEDEFEESYGFCKEINFARIHVFPFSPRPGTQAAEMKGQVKAGVKKQRSQRMLSLADESDRAFRERFLGRMMPVLWEQKKNGIWSGLTGNYIRVYTRSSDDLTNQITDVKMDKLYRDGVLGDL